MLVKFDNDLEKQEFYIDGTQVAEIENPFLTLDPARMSQTEGGRAALETFGSVPTTIEYDGVKNVWMPQKYPGTWPVSIDTVFLAKTIGEDVDLEKIASVLDLGCGTGFLGQFAQSKGVKSGTYVDANPHAVRATAWNIMKYSTSLNPMICSPNETSDESWIELEHEGKTYTVSRGEGYEPIGDEKFDLIITNPPYIPVKPGDTNDINPAFGTDLLETAIKEATAHLNQGGELAINFSNVATKAVEESLATTSGRFRTKKQMDVPFRIPPVLNDAEWIDFLVSEKGLRPDKKDGYDFWHTLTAGVITYE